MEAMQKIKCLTIEDSNFPDRLRKLSGIVDYQNKCQKYELNEECV